MKGFTVPLTRRVLRMQMWVFFAWALFAVGVAVVAIAIQSFAAGPLDRSPLEAASSAPRWFLFAAGVITTALIMPVVVAHGVTRRRYAIAAGIATAVLAVGSAGLMAAGYLVERAALAAADLPQPLHERHLFDVPTHVHLVLLEYTLVFAAYLLSGSLVGACFYRFHWLTGLVTLPLTLAPVAAQETLLSTGWLGLALAEVWSGAGDALVPVAGALAVLAVALAAALRLTLDLPIRPKRP